ncbi:MAG: hypothetical protein JWP01_1006 [Myxococcales bacterium]|nr:hypothetical protein [Myxococcales bacterium]
MRSAVLAVVCGLAIATPGARADVPRSQRVLELGIHQGVPWPVINAPIDGPLPPAPAASEPPPVPPTRAGTRVVDLVERIRTSLRASIYQPSTKVSEKDGLYHWDCSGMAAWILRRAAPLALRALNSSRPVARDFVTAIERAPAHRARKGWQRIARVADVMPGDVFAWRRPRGMPSKNTGHVGFVLDRPRPVDGMPGAWAVRIVDSTRGSHQDDSRTGDPDGGFGIGTLVFLTDAEGGATSYGWSGTQSEWYIVTPIVFGRVER